MRGDIIKKRLKSFAFEKTLKRLASLASVVTRSSPVTRMPKWFILVLHVIIQNMLYAKVLRGRKAMDWRGKAARSYSHMIVGRRALQNDAS